MPPLHRESAPEAESAAPNGPTGPHGRPRPVVLVTGASSGLGAALARELLPRRYRLVLTARESSLSRFAAEGLREDSQVWLRTLDVTDARQRSAVVAEVNERWGGVDVLVNNAGVAFRSVLEHVRDDERLAQMDVNFLGPMELVRLVLPGMRAKRAGRILNVSSVGGMMAMPTMAVYSASKWALEGASEALWYEVRPFGIHVTLVQPGFVHSRGFMNTRYTLDSRASLDDAHAPYHAHYENMRPFVERLMALARATPESIAVRMRRVLEQRSPPLRAPVTLDARVFSTLRRWLPRRLYHHVLYTNLPNVREWGN